MQTSNAFRVPPPRREPQQPLPLETLLVAVLSELRAFNARFDQWAAADLNGRFPYGDGLAGDRWSRRRR
jgi:hypothetical protein